VGLHPVRWIGFRHYVCGGGISNASLVMFAPLTMTKYLKPTLLALLLVNLTGCSEVVEDVGVFDVANPKQRMSIHGPCIVKPFILISTEPRVQIQKIQHPPYVQQLIDLHYSALSGAARID